MPDPDVAAAEACSIVVDVVASAPSPVDASSFLLHALARAACLVASVAISIPFHDGPVSQLHRLARLQPAS
eukprot:m.98444 g.98444  ORF g.98444 m.98444 type:complete len:71 (-) comp15557_c0_seq11:83-295(-)